MTIKIKDYDKEYIEYILHVVDLNEGDSILIKKKSINIDVKSLNNNKEAIRSECRVTWLEPTAVYKDDIK